MLPKLILLIVEVQVEEHFVTVMKRIENNFFLIKKNKRSFFIMLYVRNCFLSHSTFIQDIFFYLLYVISMLFASKEKYVDFLQKGHLFHP